jgi:hypothetical protein
MVAFAGVAGTVSHGLAPVPLSAQLTAADQVDVAVVIDFGPTSDHSPRVRIDCLKVAAGSNGSTALASATTALNLAAPTYNDTGLLCSIDGYPGSGCAGNDYDYWSYWHGGSSWSYANVGPAGWTVTNGDVEGWRYQNPSSATASDPPPGAPTTFAGACPDGVTVSTTPSELASETISTGEGVLLTIAGVAIIGLVAASVGRWRRRPQV